MDLLIVEPIEAEVRDWLAARYRVVEARELVGDANEFRRALYNVRAVIVPPALAIDAQVLHYAPVLRAVGRISGGPENIDLEACVRAKVEVVRSLTATAHAEAEYMIGALMAMLRRVGVEGPDGSVAGRELGSATVGMIGMAPSARAMSKMLSGFGTKLVGYDPALHASDGAWARWQVQPKGMRELLAVSDAVCVQLNYYSRYQGLLGERFLTHCKPNQVLVSISHSGVFDEAALGEALRNGTLAAAWLDSVEPGALEPGRPLAGIDSLQVTPRVASTTRESRLRSAWAVARRIDELLAPDDLARPDFRSSTTSAPIGLEAGPVSP